MFKAGRDLSLRGSSHLFTASSKPFSTIVSASAVLSRTNRNGVNQSKRYTVQRLDGKTSSLLHQLDDLGQHSQFVHRGLAILVVFDVLFRREDHPRSQVCDRFVVHHLNVLEETVHERSEVCTRRNRKNTMSAPPRPEPSSSFQSSCLVVSLRRRSSRAVHVVVLSKEGQRHSVSDYVSRDPSEANELVSGSTSSSGSTSCSASLARLFLDFFLCRARDTSAGSAANTQCGKEGGRGVVLSHLRFLNSCSRSSSSASSLSARFFFAILDSFLMRSSRSPV